MNTIFVPNKLVTRCLVLVQSTHKQIGFRGLPALIAIKDNMVPLALIPDVLIIQKAIDGAYKIRIACWIAAIIFLFAAFMLSWWILLGLIATIIIEVRVANSERRSWMFLSSILLSLEILTNDFAGWGTAYPSERTKAFAVLGD